MNGGEGEEARGGVVAAAAERHVAARPRYGRGLVVPAVIFLALAVGVSLFGWGIFARQSRDMRAGSSGTLLAVQKVQSDQVTRWFLDEEHDVRLLATAPGIARSLGVYVGSGASGPLPRELRSDLNLFRLGHGVDSITVVDATLKTVGESPAGAAPASVRDRALAAEALRTGAAAFSDLYLDTDGRIVIDFAAPLGARTASGSPGAVILHEDAQAVLFPLLQIWPPSLKTGQSILAEVRGDRVVSLNPSGAGGLASRPVSRPLSDTRLPAVMAVRGSKGVVQGVDYRGVPVLAAVGKIAGTPWYLVAKQDLGVIDQPIRDRALATLAWVVGIVVLAGVLLLLYWRSREARSLRDVVGAERERRRVEARYAALMREAKEIVLLVDRDNKVVEANDYALATYGYSRDELVGTDVDTFRVPQPGVTVADRTRQLDEAGGHLTFESVHRRSDGVEFPVEVGLSIVDVEGEEYVLEVVRDIGERKAADVALRDSEERYRTVFESATSGFALHEVIVDEAGEPVDFVILAANPAFEAQTGLAAADLVGRRGLDVIPGLAESGLVQRFGQVALTGEAERFEMWAPGLGRYLDQQVLSPRRGQFALIVLDITEQRSAEARLVRLSQRFEATVMASPLAMVALGGDHRIQLWNPAAAAIFGWSAEEVVGEPQPFIPADSMAQADALQERLLAGEQFSGLDLPFVRKDGARIHASASFALMRGEDASPDSVLMIIEDVTERRANVVRLARLSRLYQVLSAVTEAIPEERDPERLYEKVCRIAVEEGGFRVAWVGKRRRNGTVQVLASAGVEGAAAEIAAEVRVPTDRPGTMGIALGEGRSDTCPDIAADPRMAPFAATAEAHGLRSSAAVPIVIDGHHDMALAIYSSEPGRFDVEEVGLLERLAADVGFAIEAAGREHARRKAERQLEALNADLERRVSARTDELEAANAELEAFSYSVSHDLRAPLRALDGFSLALLEDYGHDLKGDAADYLRRIRAASQRMARLIDDLLMLSRMTRRDMTWERVDVSALARSIGRELGEDDPGRRVEFTVAPKLTADGDVQLLEVALRNLLGNAWKFTSRTAGARIDVGAEAHGEERVFFVRDNGAGFDAQYADKLFAPFNRLHGDDEFPGNGIGLATVQRIVRRHGGRVWAEGTTGKGATVWFTLGTRGDGG